MRCGVRPARFEQSRKDLIGPTFEKARNIKEVKGGAYHSCNRSIVYRPNDDFAKRIRNRYSDDTNNDDDESKRMFLNHHMNSLDLLSKKIDSNVKIKSEPAQSCFI